jgi:1-acyl-sn-glycerol-3-phosphate acyltransferase
MPLRHLLYRCPLCGTLGTSGVGDRAACPACGGTFARADAGGIEVRGAAGRRSVLTAAEAVDRVRVLGGAESDPPGGRVEVRATLSELTGAVPVRRGGSLLGWVERTGPGREGQLWIDDEAMGFRDDAGGEKRWGLGEVRGVQVASKTLQVKLCKPLRNMALGLSNASPFRWDELLRERIQKKRNKVRVLEMQPRIYTADDASAARSRRPRELPRPRRPKPGGRVAPLPLYAPVRILLRSLAPLRVRLSVQGRDAVPPTGPCVLVVNHQSLLDAPLVQAVCPRRVRAMAKSTQFQGALWRRLLTGLGAFPVRRFVPDPQAVRTALRILARGEVLAVYPEGERSWDGRLQPMRRGTLRLLASVGVPVLPVAVLGSYDVLPRWSRRLRRGRVDIRFGAPIRLPFLARRPERETAIPEISRTLCRAFAELGVPGAREPSSTGSFEVTS